MANSQIKIEENLGQTHETCNGEYTHTAKLAMNFLFLSNPARNYYKFFNSLAEEFAKDGHDIVFAVDCAYSAYVNHLESTKASIYNFEHYFSSHSTNKEILKTYSTKNLNSMLLADFERGQVLNFWRRRSHDYHDKLKSGLLSFFTEIFDRHSIDAIIFEDVAGAFSHFALCVCERNNSQYIGITSSRLPSRFAISHDPFSSHIPLQKTLDSIIEGQVTPEQDIVKWSTEYLANIDHIEPDYMALNGLDSLRLISNTSRQDKFRIWTGSLKFGFINSEHAFGIGNPLYQRFAIMRRVVLRRLRATRLDKYYSTPEKGEKFLLYPLHYHPEASTSVLAGTYLNELEVIRNIAFNLPEGIRLYVKDHRSAYGFPDLEFYESVARLPNVKLIQPFVNSKPLIRDSLAVITLTSTVGYEALLIGKRVFLYGNIFYQFHPDVVRISNPATLFDLFSQHLEAPLAADREYNLKFLQAYYLSTYSGHLNIAGQHANTLAKQLYRTIASHITKNRMLSHSS